MWPFIREVVMEIWARKGCSLATSDRGEVWL